MKMKNLNRRNFIKKSSVFSAGLGSITIIPTSVWAAKVAPSDKINVGIIGCRNKGFDILKNHLEYEDVNCVAMCDVDESILNAKAAYVRENNNQKPFCTKTFVRCWNKRTLIQ
jgi:hypothetical protein